MMIDSFNQENNNRDFLYDYGLTDEWIEKSKIFEDLILGRVISAYNSKRVDVITNEGILCCTMSNKLYTGLNNSAVAGDWVCVSQIDDMTFVIEHILERKNSFVRRKAGTINGEQIIGVNLDRIFVVTAVDDDFNPRRLERYITQAKHDKIEITIVLSKVDLTDKISFYEGIAKEIHPSGDVISISSYAGLQGLKQLMPYLRKGETIALVGSSGVGKSTIVNTLFGDEIQKVKKVNSKTSKGSHTTTTKHLRAFEKGFVLLDTPGMREFGIFSNFDELPGGFPDIEEWASYCKYNNCRHDTEMGCAVKQAVEDGHISSKRLENYKKITFEQNYLWVKGRRISKNKLKYGRNKKKK